MPGWTSCARHAHRVFRTRRSGSGHNSGMATHVALLRGINVGGRNKVPMAELRQVVTALGHTGVTTTSRPERAVQRGRKQYRGAGRGG